MDINIHIWTHTHTYVYIYIYVCVCVDHLKRCKTSTFRCHFHVLVFCFFHVLPFVFVSSTIHLNAGGHSISLGLCPTKLPVKWDIQLGQLDVPANFSEMGRGSTQEPPCRFSNQLSNQNLIFPCTVFAI